MAYPGEESVRVETGTQEVWPTLVRGGLVDLCASHKKMSQGYSNLSNEIARETGLPEDETADMGPKAGTCVECARRSRGSELGNQLTQALPTGYLKKLDQSDHRPRQRHTPGQTRTKALPPLPQSLNALGDSTDWDEHYDALPETVHRGFAMKIPGNVYDLVHDPEVDQAHVAKELINRTARKVTGPHWSTRPEVAQDFAMRSGRAGSSDLPLVLHASTPTREDIETRPHMLRRMEIFDHGGGAHDEREVPVRKGRVVQITGVSWKPHHEHPAADEQGWIHHEFGEPMLHRAAQGHYCKACGTNHDTAGEVEEHEWSHTDWDKHYPSVGDVHRGVAVRLPPELHDKLYNDDEYEHDPDQVMHEVIQHIAKHPIGMHWSADEDVAKRFADDSSGRAHGDPEHPVSNFVLTGHRPQRHEIETDPHKLDEDEEGIQGFDTPEREVPLKSGTQVRLKGIQYKQPFHTLHQYREHPLDEIEEHVGPIHVHAAREDWPGLSDEHYEKYIKPHEKDAEPQDFWRAHLKSRPFSRDDAWSADLTGGDEDRGYSAFRTPQELHHYLTQSGTGEWGGWNLHDRDVIRFKGREVGTGVDEEPLAEPHGDEPEERMSWDEFDRRHRPHKQAAREELKPLPDKLYHVTTARDDVLQHGLKTRDELGQQYGHGLGGGRDDTISLTSHRPTAEHLLHSLHEYHDVLNGKIKLADLKDKARQGIGAKKPYDYMLKDHPDEDLAAADKSRTIEHRMHDRSEVGEDWHPLDEGMHGTGPKGDYHLHMSWDRPLGHNDLIAKRSDVYKKFAWGRQAEGGHPDPLFIANDPINFVSKDPGQFALMHVRPREGAQGVHMNDRTEGTDAGEWRATSGKDLDIVHHESRKDITPRTAAGDYSERAVDQDLPEEVHRGVAMYLPEELHDAVHDESRPIGERAQMISDHLRSSWNGAGRVGLGQHWTSNHGTAAGYSKKYKSENPYAFEPDPRFTRVVLHAKTPTPGQMLSSERTLRSREIFGHEHDEKEVPVRRNATLHLVGLSFGPNVKGGELTRHDFDEPLRHKAAKYPLKYTRMGQNGYEDVNDEIEGPFFHGSRSKRLKPGDLITPGRKTNSWGDEGPKSQFVHYTGRHDVARDYADQAGGHVYEVEPTGESHHGYGEEEYKSKHPLRVVRVANEPPEQEDDFDWPHLGSRKTAKWGDETHLSWDEIGERHPQLYGDPEVHGEDADGADGEGIGWAASQIAHSTPDDPDAENHGSWDLLFQQEHVDPKHIDYMRHEPGDYRVNHARQGYEEKPSKVPPLVLVHRHGVYQVADGHHRAEGAAKAGKKVRAYVAYSPFPDEPDGNGDKAPYMDAKPHPGKNRHTASKTAALKNPIGEHEWYHGTPYDHGEHGFLDPAAMHPLAHEDDPYDSTHWNTLLGSHFTADHKVAEQFARGGASSDHQGEDEFADDDYQDGPGIIHAQLHIKRPKVYKSEYDMDQEVHEFEHGQGNHIDPHIDEGGWDEWGEDAPHGYEHKGDSERGPYTKNEYHKTYRRPMATHWLNSHPDKFEIAARYKDRLIKQGYDGVIYGNEFEKSRPGAGPPSAIAFHPHQIEITQRHHPDEDHMSEQDAEHERSKPRPMPGQTELFKGGMLDAFHASWDDDDDEKPEWCEECGEEHTPEEGHRECAACGERHEDYEEKSNHESTMTDWDHVHPRLNDTVHRVFPHMRLPDHVHEVVHDESRPMHERGKALLDHVAGEHGRALGMHWSDVFGEGKGHGADKFAGVGGGNSEDTQVVLHAHKPHRDHIETDPDTLDEHQVYGYDVHDENEVPITRYAPVHITGVSWRPGGYHQEWRRHDLKNPMEMTAMRKHAHDSGDSQRIFHCPFCGGGQVIGRSDGTTECEFCGTHFTVQVQPTFNSFPQTDPETGMPIQIPGMPGQIDGALGMDPQNDLPPGAPGAPPGVEPGDDSDNPFGDGSDDDAGGQEGSADDGGDDGDDKKPDFLKSKGYRTASGDVLTEAQYVKHLAILHAPDRESVLSVLRRVTFE